MKKPLIFAAVALVACAAAVLIAQAPDERDAFELRRTLIDRIEDAYTSGDTETLKALANIQEPAPRMPTIEELEALVANPPPPLVPIDSFKARSAAQTMLDAADDEEIVWLYLGLLDAKNEYIEIKRGIAEVEARVKENRERRERAQRERAER